ncbi:MAG: protein-L-isoaspartate O-methyltransferase [Neisseria sp.]|nr:protein-L-isoaspartate O-methyltransferase [Neisseria sp.]
MDFEKARFNMVEQQIRPWDVLDFDVLDALGDIPREYFVGEAFQGLAYADQTLPLPNGSRMLEPRIVARLVQGLALKKTDRVLEIGTGSGYASALLSKLAGEVATVDIDETQQNLAKAALERAGCGNVSFHIADGLKEAHPAAPFDAVYVGGSVPAVPAALLEQLKDSGRMVVIVGTEPVQRALLVTKNDGETTEKVLFDTLVPALDGQAAKAADPFDF